MSQPVKIGIIGGGLMGREVASALGRWMVLENVPVQAQLTAVCDLAPAQRDWFKRVPGVKLLTADYRELLASPEVDVVYVAVPHHLHETLYLDVLRAGKDLFAEKPFGIDRQAAEAITRVAKETGRFVRCSSEFPFFPGGQAAFQLAQEIVAGRHGRVLEVRSGFHHSSDLDPSKAANWKRQSATCGEIGVMGDLGMHAVHLPFRLGLQPHHVYAQLQKGVSERPDGKGGVAPCDTWDNAQLHTQAPLPDGSLVPVTFEMKRLAPGATNTWFFEILANDAGVRFSTQEPKTLWRFHRDGSRQQWERVDLGFQSVFPTITGGIFEHGFTDCFLQMWAAFLTERAGALEGRFGCITPEEALASHRLFEAALRSQAEGAVIPVEAGEP